MQRIILNKCVSKYFETPEKMSYKFGYYNYSPMNIDGDKLLAHKVDFEGRLPNADDKVDIGFFSLPNCRWHKIAASNAFNWQQGAMLQWLGPDYNNEVIFNDALDGQYISRIIDVHSKKERKLPKAIYGIDPKGEYSISLHFERCNFTRAYSYASITNRRWDKKLPEEDGVIKINLKTGEWTTIISLKEIVDFAKKPEFENCTHWLEHIILNPKGNRFAFYHRYSTGDNAFATRLFTADYNGKNIWLHPNKITDNITHLGWLDDNKYVLYTYPRSRISAMWSGLPGKRKKGSWYKNFYRTYVKSFIPQKAVSGVVKKTSYYAFTKDKSHIIDAINPLPGSMDGHPSFSNDRRFMLTDTYADKKGYRHLLLYDMVKKETITLGKIFSYYNNCNWRADLHPRFSRDNKYVIIDSTHNGYHQMMVLCIDWKQLL